MSGQELFIRFTARPYRKLLSVYVFSYFPFGFEGRIWALIISVPDCCLSFYLTESFMPEPSLCLRPAHRRTIKEVCKVVNRDCVNYQACSLSLNIHVVSDSFERMIIFQN